jgi:uncharacterized protein YifE (UPF0438 family)
MRSLKMPNETTQKRSFDVAGEKYAVRVPTVDEIKQANEMRAKTFNEALSRGDLLRDQLETELRRRKLWNDKREEEYQTLRAEVLDGEYKLQKGGVRLGRARGIALDMTDKRNKMVEMLSARTDLDSNTCEGKADAARFNFLFSCCLVYDDSGDHYFPNKLDDYLLNQDDEVALAGATEFYYLISGSDSVDNRLPENKFLKKFKFADQDLRLIDSDGRLITKEGKHIDKNGNFVKWNKDGTSTKVDPVGRTVTEDGDFAVKHAPFLDDSGEPINESDFPEETEEASDEVEEVAEEVTEEVTEEVAEEKDSEPKPKSRKKKAVKTKIEETEAEQPSD